MKLLAMPLPRSLEQLPRVTARQALVLAVAMGLALRLYHFFRLPSVWHDEAVVLLSAIHLNFYQLLGPLIHHEAAPPLFMMIERVMFLTFGDTLYVFRALPLAASCLSLCLLASIAWQLLPRPAAVLATALFAVSDRLLYHAIEAKPYALDVLFATALIWLELKSRDWSLRRRCLTALAFFPVALWLSFPACFMLGGWFLAQVPMLLRSRSRGDWIAAITLAVAVAGSFLVLLTGPIAAQRDASMESCWHDGFPDWSRVWTVPIWATVSTFNILGYCVHPQGWLLAGFVIVGSIWMQRTHGPLLLTLMLAPWALNFVAALAGKYPYSGQRVLVYMTPAVVLLTAAGVPPVVAWCRRHAPAALLIVLFTLALPFVNTARRTVEQWNRPNANEANALVRERWQPGDRIAFNNWEAEYALWTLRDAWIVPGETIPPGRQRLWYVALAPDPAVRETVIRAIPPVWQAVERREFKGVTVLLLTTDSADATASHIPTFSD